MATRTPDRMILTPDQMRRMFGELPGAPAAVAAPASAPGRMVLTPDQMRRMFGGTPEELEAQKPSALESFGRGVAQGVTLGFADEISGGLESAFTDKTYRQARDESRANYRAAEAANPTASFVGNLAGSVATAAVPGLGVARGAGLLAKAGLGAAGGAVAGLGASEAESAGGMARDAAVGGVIGAGTAGALHGAGKLLKAGKDAAGEAIGKATKGAAEVSTGDARYLARDVLMKAEREGDEKFAEAARQYAPLLRENAAAMPGAKVAPGTAATPEGAVKVAKAANAETAFKELLDSVGNKVKMQAFGLRGNKVDAIKKRLVADKELRLAVAGGDESAEQAAQVIDKRLSKYGQQADKIYDIADPYAKGGTVDDVVKALEEVQKRYAGSPPTRKLAEAMEAEIKAYRETFQPGERIPLQRLRRDYRSYQDHGFANANVLNPNETKQLQVEAAQAIRGVLHAEIEAASKANPEIGKLLPALKDINSKIAAYSDLKKIMAEKSTRVAAAAQTMGEVAAHGVNPELWAAKKSAAVRRAFVAPGETVLGGAFDVATKAARKVNLEARAAGARKAERRAMEEALAEVDALTPGSPTVATKTIARELAGDTPGKVKSSQALAALVKGAREGAGDSDLSGLVARAVEAGVPRATAERIVEAYSGQRREGYAPLPMSR